MHSTSNLLRRQSLHVVSLYMLVAGFWLGIATGLASAEGQQLPPWESGLEHAIERAKAEGKFLLIAFRGPESSAVCKRINEEVLDSAEFRTVMGAEFVLFHVLAPEDAQRDDDQEAIYQELLKRFNVVAYPIVLVATPDGQVYGEAALQRVDPSALIQEISQLRDRRRLLAETFEAAKSDRSPEEAAVGLSTALEKLGLRFSVTRYRPLVDQVINLDPEDELGLKTLWNKRIYAATTEWKFAQIYGPVSSLIGAMGSAAEKVKRLDEMIQEHRMDGELRQLMEWQKYRAWKSENNYPKMIESAKIAYELAPHTFIGKKLPSWIEGAEKLQAEQVEQEKAADATKAEGGADGAAADTDPQPAAQPPK